jgi:repressor of nif and glnA expression
MNVATLTLPEIIEIEKVKSEKKFITDILENYDLLDIMILRMFYTDNNFPADTVPRSLNEVWTGLKNRGIKISKTTVLYRLKKLAGQNIIKKLESTNPSMFQPISSEDVINKVSYIIRLTEAIVSR